jgi:hypothetical protein
MRVALATCSAFPGGTPDDRAVAALLDADVRAWDDPAVDWEVYDRVIVCSTWDYVDRVEAFVAWCRAIGPQRLRNDPPLYARVDLLTGNDGEPLLIELEVAEPALYLATAPGAAERFAAAIRAS